MASVPQPIKVSITASPTTLYTAFVDGSATRAMLVSLDFANTGTVDVTMDVYYLQASGSVKFYLAKTLTVPALGTAAWRGLDAMATSTDSWVAVASTTGVDATGTVVENA